MLALPPMPALVSSYGRSVLLTADDEFLDVEAGELADHLGGEAPLVIHAPATLKRLGSPPIPTLDLLELFAFIFPARSLAPTASGLARALDMDQAKTIDDAVAELGKMADLMLTRLSTGRDLPANRDAAGLAARMGAAGWLWAPYVLAGLGAAAAPPDGMAMRLWKRLPRWEEDAARPPPSSFPVDRTAARRRLAAFLGPAAEQRQAQADFASAATDAFAPRRAEGSPHVVLAEAGTGTGKTLAYLAPSSLWAEQNKGQVWVSTYTRHLQRQIEQEAVRLGSSQKIMVRKGRENYLCLLNYEDQIGIERYAVPMGLIARWAMASADCDLLGGDLPGWFAELFGQSLIASLADRRGECIHAACPHYTVCPIEHMIRKAQQADLVIANHALVMAQAVWGGLDDEFVPTRYVFDEGHHIFDAADSAFSVELSGMAMSDLRRWILGAEGTRSRARGLAKRLEDFIASDETLAKHVQAAVNAAHALPAPMFAARFEQDLVTCDKPAESFLHQLRAQVYARAAANDAKFGTDIEVDLYPLNPEILPAAQMLARALEKLRLPLAALHAQFLEKLEIEADTLDQAARQRIEGLTRTLTRRAILPVTAWKNILDRLKPEIDSAIRPSEIQFLHLSRDAGNDRDVALQSHLLDPTEAFIQTIVKPAHGLLITSATLRDETDEQSEWEGAEARTGAAHLAMPAIRAAFESPFDYAARTKIVLISDVNQQDIGSLAGAFRALFQASHGGALGLFTAISRLKAVHARIAAPLEDAGLSLYAQHVDAMDNGTLVDIFREEENSCLLGTDAMRDGVDVPGRSLRLVVFEKTPWPRPDILHRSRRIHLSNGTPKAYDDTIVRLRLRQAFGRLIRRADDRGVFVLLDRQIPSRLLTAFPETAPIIRSSLAEAVQGIKQFLGPSLQIRE